MISTNYQVTVTLPVTVNYSISSSTKGARDSFGAQEEPDENASIEIDSVLWQGIEILGLLSPEELEELEENIQSEEGLT